MNKISSIVCNAFLNRYSPQKKTSFLSYLSTDLRQCFEKLPPTAEDPADGFESIEARIQEIHYSWFAPFLRTLSEGEIKLFLSSLKEEQAIGLKNLLLFSNYFVILTPFIKNYLQELLFSKISEEIPDLLPFSCLPEDRLNCLLKLKDNHLEQIIDFLGIHDLAAEIRTIIDTHKIKQIYQALSLEEQQYLKLLLQKKEPIIFRKIGLESWNGDPKILKNALYQRGINRLAKVLFRKEASLVWYISHKLNISRFSLFQKFCSDLKNEKTVDLLETQLNDLVVYLKNKALI